MPDEPYLAHRRLRCFWLVLALVATLATMTSCQTAPEPPPAPSPVAVDPMLPAAVEQSPGVYRIMADVPAAPRLLLFAWFGERFAAVAVRAVDQAKAGAQQAAQEVAAAARQSWIDRGGGLVTARPDGRLTVSGQAVAAQQSQPGFTTRLQALLDAGDASPEAAPSLAECLDGRLWPEPMRGFRDDFAAWYKRHDGRLRLAPLPGLDVVRRDVQQLLAAAEVREKLWNRLVAVEELERRRKFTSAMKELDGILVDRDASDALRTLRDTDTPQRLADKRLFLPQMVVSAECEYLRTYHGDPLGPATADLSGASQQQLADVERRVRLLETRLSLRLTQWQADARFSGALHRYADEVEALIQTALAGRLALWEAQLRAVQEPLRSWQQYELLQPWLASLRDYSGPGGVAYRYLDAGSERVNPLPYRVLQTAEERLLPIYGATLADTFAGWRQFAERQVSLHLRHGLDLALADRMQEMVLLFRSDALPVGVQDHLRWARERTAASLERFRANQAGCTLRIEPFASVTAGLGQTWARDLETRLRDMLAQTGQQAFAQVVATGATGDPLPRSLTVAHGRIADFGADETTEKASMREVTETSQPQPFDNGHLVAGYTQTVSRRAIHVVTIERVAHVRIGFQIVLGDDAEDMEVNHFFRKQFVQESSHPFLDAAVVETRKVDQRSELPPASEPLTLRSDRVWTPSEMLDWSRRIVLDEMALRVNYRLTAFPLELVRRAQVATQREDWLAAADAWGYAVAYLSRVHPPRPPQPDAPELPAEIAARQAEVETWQAEARRQLADVLRHALAAQSKPEVGP